MFRVQTTVSPVAQEDFAHCKDEMDVIIVHCGFRLCTVKLWTVKCTGKFLWKKTESLEEPVKRLSCMPGFFSDDKCVNFTFSCTQEIKIVIFSAALCFFHTPIKPEKPIIDQ